MNKAIVGVDVSKDDFHVSESLLDTFESYYEWKQTLTPQPWTEFNRKKNILYFERSRSGEEVWALMK